jgi:RNA polymerase sigma factor (sigma-70 family)
MTTPLLSKPERDALVLSHRGLSKRLAYRLAYGMGVGHRYQDALHEGIVGLVEAANRFDPSRGLKFSTFAAFYVRLRITRHLNEHRHTVRPSRASMSESLACKIGPSERRLASHLGRVPSGEEMAKDLGCTPDQIEATRSRLRPGDIIVSHVDDEVGRYTPQADGANQEDRLGELQIERARTKAVCRAMSTLDKREKEIVRRRYFADQSERLSDIAASWGVSRQRVKQIEDRALGKMRAALKRHKTQLMDGAA